MSLLIFATCLIMRAASSPTAKEPRREGGGGEASGQRSGGSLPQDPQKPSQQRLVVTATKPGEYFGCTSRSVDAHRLITDSVQDLIEVANPRLARGEGIVTLGTSTDRIYAVFQKPGCTSRGELEVDPSIMSFNSWGELEAASRSERPVRVVTRMASLRGEIVALFEGAYDGEESRLFSHCGNLTANTLHGLENRRSVGLLTAEYFAAEDRWMFVFSNKAPIEEKWSVGPLLDRAFIQRGYDEGYCIRQLVASPRQWFLLMQRTEALCAARQSILYTNTSSLDFELRMWENGYVITSACGNMPYATSATAAAN